MNPEGDEYGDDRLIACANAHLGKPPQDVLDAIFADVKTFCADATQAADPKVVQPILGHDTSQGRSPIERSARPAARRACPIAACRFQRAATPSPISERAIAGVRRRPPRRMIAAP